MDNVGVFRAGEPEFTTLFGMAIENFLRALEVLTAVVSFGEPPPLLEVLVAAVVILTCLGLSFRNGMGW